jgi:cell division protein FtsQ
MGSEVLEAPLPGYAQEARAPEASWQGRGPAPAGALQRGYAGGFPEEGGGSSAESGYGASFDSEFEESPYVARRGFFSLRLRRLPKSTGGRILLGVGAMVVVMAAAVALAGTRYYVVHDGRFVVTTSGDIQIAGNQHLTRAQVLSVFGSDLERNIFKVPLAERRTDLERLPWIAHATVMRLLPDKIRVQITERVPVAFVRQGTQIGLVDATGVLLDMPPEDAGDPNYSFPVLTGLVAGDPVSTRAARMEIYKQFMAALDGGGEKVSQSISEVDVSNPEDVKALVASGGTDILVHFGDELFLERYKEFKEHLGQWKQQYPKLASADMRYEGQIVLEMLPGATVPLSGDAAAAKTEAVGTPSAAVKAAAVKPKALAVASPKAAAAAVSSDGADAPVAKPAVAKATPAKTVGHPAGSSANAKMAAALAAARQAAGPPTSVAKPIATPAKPSTANATSGAPQ